MKPAFKLVSVPLLSSCLPVLGVCGEQPWCQQPQSLALALEQSIRCFYVHCFCMGGKTSVGHPDPKAQGREGQQRAVGMCWWWVSAERNFVMQLFRGLLYLQSQRKVWIQLSQGQEVSSGKSPACLPAEAQTRMKSSITLVKEVKIPRNYSSKRGKEEKQNLVIPFGKGCLCGRMQSSCKEEVCHMIKGLVHILNRRGANTLFSHFARRKWQCGNLTTAYG